MPRLFPLVVYYIHGNPCSGRRNLTSLVISSPAMDSKQIHPKLKLHYICQSRHMQQESSDLSDSSQGFDTSPAQRLFSRRTKALLPLTDELLKPIVQTDVTRQTQKNNQQQKYYFDKQAHPLQDLKTGDTVRIMPHGSQKEWTKAKVQRKIAPRSYEVITEHNRSYRRNRRHL